MIPGLLVLSAAALLVCEPLGIFGIELAAHVSESGLHGEVTFHSDGRARLRLQSVSGEGVSWSWAVHAFPVDYTQVENRCSPEKIGPSIHNLDDVVGVLTFPDNSSSEAIIPGLKLTGESGLWGKSLLFQSEDGSKACASIVVSSGGEEKLAEARFFSPISGRILVRWLGSKKANFTDVLIHVNLEHTPIVTPPLRDLSENGTMNVTMTVRPRAPKHKTTQHGWKLYATDILDSEADKSRGTCNFLNLIYDPVSVAGRGPVGDLSARLGPVPVGKLHVRHDPALETIEPGLLNSLRSLYFVIFDHKHPDSYLSCSKLRLIEPSIAKAVIQKNGIVGEVTFEQRSSMDPTWIHWNLTRKPTAELWRKISSYKVHELPPLPPTFTNRHLNLCTTTGGVYNPTNQNLEEGGASHETYAIGDLSGKHNMWRENQTLEELINNGNRRWDATLPLLGRFSVMHRSIVVYSSEGDAWLCGTLTPYRVVASSAWKLPLTTAVVSFRYPVVGRVLIRQPAERHWADSTVLIEYLVHADGTSTNNTDQHRWAVHQHKPGKDFYDWQNRCLSTGPVYNPHKIVFDPEERCYDQWTCAPGDLGGRQGRLQIAGSIGNATRLSRALFTDPAGLLALSGPYSVLGRSLVLYGDNGPKARGERLACSIIGGLYRRKAVVRDWHGNGIEAKIRGKMEFFQSTEYDLLDVEMELSGMTDVDKYHIHMTPVEGNLEFPCEATSLYDVWDPFNVTASASPLQTQGTSDQYRAGDLSGKHGGIDGQQAIHLTYNDTGITLFGPMSFIGRSLVLQKTGDKTRGMIFFGWLNFWGSRDADRLGGLVRRLDESCLVACSTIERGYSPSEARELRAIASFHHPLGFAWGYVRMTQLVYNDNSKSDTIIEVNLRHPGVNDRNFTRNHNWAIYVNPVGVDASVKILNTRCVAGGYIWNPFYTQLADPLNDELYRAECGPDNPLRCYVGDLSGRLGTIDLGGKRRLFTDPNLPLEGEVSAMGRSIVILTKERGHEKFACANIEPDKDIIKYINIERPPRFVVAQFLEEMREVMGIPEWMLTVDSRKTRTLHNHACIQLLLHFKGGIANQLEQDLGRLLNNGKLSSPSLKIHGYVPSSKRKTEVSYRPCGSTDPNEKRQRKFRNNAKRIFPFISLMFISSVIFFVF